MSIRHFDVTGMSCAACSSRVEKAVSELEGITSCSVSLLTNSMGIEGSASDDDIIKAVENAGYGASLKGDAKNLSKEEDSLTDKESPKLKKRLLSSMFFLIALMYISMGHMMMSLPLPNPSMHKT